MPIDVEMTAVTTEEAMNETTIALHRNVTVASPAFGLSSATGRRVVVVVMYGDSVFVTVVVRLVAVVAAVVFVDKILVDVVEVAVLGKNTSTSPVVDRSPLGPAAKKTVNKITRYIYIRT